MPSALERQGNFTDARNSAGQLQTILDPNSGKAPFPGNIIPQSRWNSYGAAILNWAIAAYSQQYAYPYLNPNLPLEQRADNIVSHMTLDEKSRGRTRTLAAEVALTRCRRCWITIFAMAARTCTSVRLWAELHDISVFRICGSVRPG